MIKITHVSIFEAPSKILVNPVNTVGVMGKGLALEFRERYPAMFRFYKAACSGGGFKVGSLLSWGNGKVNIVNFATKEHWRQPSSLEIIEAGLIEFCRLSNARHLPLGAVSFPQLGCGEGGLNWKRDVMPLMFSYLDDLRTVCYIHVYKNQFQNKSKND